MTLSLRLAFNCMRWHPTKEQFVTALSMIQNEERSRVCGFVFQKDVKASLVRESNLQKFYQFVREQVTLCIGRLMIRKAIRTCLKLKNENILLGRTEQGRPFLHGCQGPGHGLDFNLSHHEDLVVLACETSARVGIDTVSLERQVGSSSPERFLELMRRQLSDGEWRVLNELRTERERLCHFFRIWVRCILVCMKESYVKAIGTGIGFSLGRLECCTKEDLPQDEREDFSEMTGQTSADLPGRLWRSPEWDEPHCGSADDDKVKVKVVGSSFIKVDGAAAKGWKFEESQLLEKYIVCVAVERLLTSSGDSIPFRFVTVEELLEDHAPLAPGEFEGEWDAFLRKEYKPGR